MWTTIWRKSSRSNNIIHFSTTPWTPSLTHHQTDFSTVFPFWQNNSCLCNPSDRLSQTVWLTISFQFPLWDPYHIVFLVYYKFIAEVSRTVRALVDFATSDTNSFWPTTRHLTTPPYTNTHTRVRLHLYTRTRVTYSLWLSMMPAIKYSTTCSCVVIFGSTSRTSTSAFQLTNIKVQYVFSLISILYYTCFCYVVYYLKCIMTLS